MNDSRNPTLRVPRQGQRLDSSRSSPPPVKPPAQALNLQPVSPVADCPFRLKCEQFGTNFEN